MTLSELKAATGLDLWRFQLDNPTILGWTVVAFYEMAALACARAAVLRRRIGDTSPWWILAAGLCFLGINKQANLQTLLIVIGRHLSETGGWYEDRRTIQLIFSAVFALGLGVILIWLAFKYRGFFKLNRFAFWGVVVLGLFVGMRAATIDHVDEFLKINLKDEKWAWVLEITGSVLIGLGAIRHEATGGGA